MKENYEDELYLITFTTMKEAMGSCNIKECRYNTLKWFYEQVKDILERNRESHL